jgi:RsiW-degrading membrane proteinase PrsW (M82 family)
VTAEVSVRLVRLAAAAACIAGLVILAVNFTPEVRVFPGPAVLAVAVQVPVVVIGFWLLRRLRPIRAPARAWSVAAVVWGATAATGYSVVANDGLLALWAKGAGIRFAADWAASLTAPLNEEILKLAGVALIALAAPGAIRGPVDGMIYGALTGLGFQVMENVTYGLSAVQSSGAVNPSQAAGVSVLGRVGLAGLGSHWIMTAVAGAGIGYLAAWGVRRGAWPAIICLVAAMAMHLFFDAPSVNILVNNLVDFVVGATFFLILRKRYMIRAKDAATALVAEGALTDLEAHAILSRRGRRRMRNTVHGGAERARLAHHQQYALAAIEDRAATSRNRPSPGLQHAQLASIAGSAFTAVWSSHRTRRDAGTSPRA